MHVVGIICVLYVWYMVLVMCLYVDICIYVYDAHGLCVIYGVCGREIVWCTMCGVVWYAPFCSGYERSNIEFIKGEKFFMYTFTSPIL